MLIRNYKKLQILKISNVVPLSFFSLKTHTQEIEPPQQQPPPKKAVAPESSKLNQSMEYDANARARLREVEVKVMKLQDDIESGKKKLRDGETMQQALKEYREKLLEKVSLFVK